MIYIIPFISWLRIILFEIYSTDTIPSFATETPSSSTFNPNVNFKSLYFAEVLNSQTTGCWPLGSRPTRGPGARSCRRSGRMGGKGRFSAVGEVDTLLPSLVCIYLTVPVSIDTVPGSLVASTQLAWRYTELDNLIATSPSCLSLWCRLQICTRHPWGTVSETRRESSCRSPPAFPSPWWATPPPHTGLAGGGCGSHLNTHQIFHFLGNIWIEVK